MKTSFLCLFCMASTGLWSLSLDTIRLTGPIEDSIALFPHTSFTVLTADASKEDLPPLETFQSLDGLPEITFWSNLKLQAYWYYFIVENQSNAPINLYYIGITHNDVDLWLEGGPPLRSGARRRPDERTDPNFLNAIPFSLEPGKVFTIIVRKFNYVYKKKGFESYLINSQTAKTELENYRHSQKVKRITSIGSFAILYFFAFLAILLNYGSFNKRYIWYYAAYCFLLATYFWKDHEFSPLHNFIFSYYPRFSLQADALFNFWPLSIYLLFVDDFLGVKEDSKWLSNRMKQFSLWLAIAAIGVYLMDVIHLYRIGDYMQYALNILALILSVFILIKIHKHSTSCFKSYIIVASIILVTGTTIGSILIYFKRELYLRDWEFSPIIILQIAIIVETFIFVLAIKKRLKFSMLLPNKQAEILIYSDHHKLGLPSLNLKEEFPLDWVHTISELKDRLLPKYIHTLILDHTISESEKISVSKFCKTNWSLMAIRVIWVTPKLSLEDVRKGVTHGANMMISINDVEDGLPHILQFEESSAYENMKPAILQTEKKHQQELFEKMHWFVIQQLDNDEFATKLLEKTFHCGTQTVNRNFKKHLSLPPVKFVKQLRIDSARWLLVFTNISIEKISKLTGFKSHQSFTKAYRKICKTSPSQTREQKPFL